MQESKQDDTKVASLVKMAEIIPSVPISITTTSDIKDKNQTFGETCLY